MKNGISFLRSAAVFAVAFARARAAIFAAVFAATAAIGLAACGGGGGGSGGGVSTPEGYFHGADRVAGLRYEYAEDDGGETDERGRFPLRGGQTVSFSIGRTAVGTMTVRSDSTGDEIVTPLGIGDQSRALKVEQLLLALDGDSSDNLIDLREILDEDTEDLFAISNLDSDGGPHSLPSGRQINIMSEAEVMAELDETHRCAYTGVYFVEGDDERTGIAFMPALNVELSVERTSTTVTFSASPLITFVDRPQEDPEQYDAYLTLDLKTPPVSTAVPGDDLATLVLASYNRMEALLGDGSRLTAHRVVGDPNANYRLVGVDDRHKSPFAVDIYDGGNAQIHSTIPVDSDLGQFGIAEIRSGTAGDFPEIQGDRGADTTGDLTLDIIDGDLSLTLSFDGRVFYAEDADNALVGTWCRL